MLPFQKQKHASHIAVRRLISLFTAVIVAGSSLPAVSAENAQSALPPAVSEAVPALNMESIDLPTDYYSTLKVTGAKGSVKWSSGSSDIVLVEDMGENSADIIGKKPGTAYIFASVDGKTLRCRVNVARSFIYAGSNEEKMYPGDIRTVRISVTGSKDISMKYDGKKVFSPSWGRWSGNSIDITLKGVSSGSDSLDLYTADKQDHPACSVSVTVDDRDDSSPWSVKTDPDSVSSPRNPALPNAGSVFPLSERVTETYESLCSEMNEIIAGYPYECAVLLYSPKKGYLYRHNADKYMPGGCTVKVPYVYYCCLRLENGDHSLDEMIEYQPKHRVGGSGVIQNYAYGTKWSIGTLLDYSMRYSDNAAYYMLISVFGKDGFNEMIKGWGYNTRLGASNYPDVNAELLNTSMLRLHEKVTSSDDDCWQAVWTGLLEAEFYEVKKEINYCDVAVKCGLPRSYYNEVCYIDSEVPYVLVIMSKTNNAGEHRDGDEKFFRSAARCADRINRVRTG